MLDVAQHRVDEFQALAVRLPGWPTPQAQQSSRGVDLPQTSPTEAARVAKFVDSTRLMFRQVLLQDGRGMVVGRLSIPLMDVQRLCTVRANP